MHGRSAEFIGEDFSRSAAQEPANALRDAGVDRRTTVARVAAAIPEIGR